MKTSELIWQDKQHQVLFELIDQIEQGQADMTVFNRLTYYAENHFTLEEEYMLRLQYPATDQHIQSHDKFRHELSSMKQECHNFDDKFCLVLATFLREWLTSHIFGIDKQLEEFILSSDSK